jgi:hypothetical protein
MMVRKAAPCRPDLRRDDERIAMRCDNESPGLTNKAGPPRLQRERLIERTMAKGMKAMLFVEVKKPQELNLTPLACNKDAYRSCIFNTLLAFSTWNAAFPATITQS